MSHPNVPNAAKYQQLNRGGSVHSSFVEEQQQQEQQQQQQQHRQNLENPGRVFNFKNESDLVQVHVTDVKDSPFDSHAQAVNV